MITIGFFSGTSLFAQGIKLLTNSPVSHSAIGFCKDNKWYWLHAVGSGVQIVDRGWEGNLYAEFQVLPNVENEVEIAERKVGEPYSKLTILGFVIIIIAKWFGIGIHNPFYEKSAVVCSELIIEADVYHQIPEFNGLDPADISPGILLNICTNGKSFKRIL